VGALVGEGSINLLVPGHNTLKGVPALVEGVQRSKKGYAPVTGLLTRGVKVMQHTVAHARRRVDICPAAPSRQGSVLDDAVLNDTAAGGAAAGDGGGPAAPQVVLPPPEPPHDERPEAALQRVADVVAYQAGVRETNAATAEDTMQVLSEALGVLRVAREAAVPQPTAAEAAERLRTGVLSLLQQMCGRVSALASKELADLEQQVTAALRDPRAAELLATDTASPSRVLSCWVACAAEDPRPPPAAQAPPTPPFPLATWQQARRLAALLHEAAPVPPECLRVLKWLFAGMLRLGFDATDVMESLSISRWVTLTCLN
jgi:hypothetical protein